MVKLLLLFLLLPLAAHSGEQDQRRLIIGLNLFPAVLAADSAISTKVNKAGELELLLLYLDERNEAQQLASRLASFAPIHGLAINVQIASIGELPNYETAPLAGIFLVEPLSDALAVAASFGEQHHILVFSPFEGDVERGAVTGLYVSDQILPFVNMKVLERSAIVLRPFFLEVAKHHD